MALLRKSDYGEQAQDDYCEMVFKILQFQSFFILIYVFTLQSGLQYLFIRLLE